MTLYNYFIFILDTYLAAGLVGSLISSISMQAAMSFPSMIIFPVHIVGMMVHLWTTWASGVEGVVNIH